MMRDPTLKKKLILATVTIEQVTKAAKYAAFLFTVTATIA